MLKFVFVFVLNGCEYESDFNYININVDKIGNYKVCG